MIWVSNDIMRLRQATSVNVLLSSKGNARMFGSLPMVFRSLHWICDVPGSSEDVTGENRWKPLVSKCFTKPNPIHAWKCMREPAAVTTTDTTILEVNSTGKVEITPNLASSSDR